MRTATNTTNDDTDDLDTMTDAAAKLALAIAQYGNGAGLPNDHPWHQLKSLQGEMTDAIADERRKRAADPRYNDGRMVARPNARDDRYNDSQPRKDADALGEHMGRGARSEPLDDDVAKSWEAVLDAEAELIAVQTGVTIEKAYVAALDKRPDAVRKMYGHPEPDQPLAKANDPREKVWIEIEGAADAIIQKSRYALTREAAIDRVMKARPDLVKRYYGDDSGPTA